MLNFVDRQDARIVNITINNPIVLESKSNYAYICKTSLANTKKINQICLRCKALNKGRSPITDRPKLAVTAKNLLWRIAKSEYSPTFLCSYKTIPIKLLRDLLAMVYDFYIYKLLPNHKYISPYQVFEQSLGGFRAIASAVIFKLFYKNFNFSHL